MNMNKINFWALFWLILLLATISLFSRRNAVKTNENTLKRDTIVVYVDRCAEKVNWNAFIEALIWVESKGDASAIGNSDDVGILQIKKVMVDECNRIIGYKHFEYEDRFDSTKSVQMFNIVQKHYNPKMNIHLALKIWNSKSNLDYHTQVEKKYNEICKKIERAGKAIDEQDVYEWK